MLVANTAQNFCGMRLSSGRLDIAWQSNCTVNDTKGKRKDFIHGNNKSELERQEVLLEFPIRQ